MKVYQVKAPYQEKNVGSTVYTTEESFRSISKGPTVTFKKIVQFLDDDESYKSAAKIGHFFFTAEHVNDNGYNN